jgi:hypothetical protein
VAGSQALISMSRRDILTVLIVQAGQANAPFLSAAK